MEHPRDSNSFVCRKESILYLDTVFKLSQAVVYWHIYMHVHIEPNKKK